MEDSSKYCKRELGLWNSIGIIIAIVIGVGIFKVPADVARFLNSSHLILLAWIVGGAISVMGALCFAELSSSFPKTGGTYTYLKESYGPMMGFLFGWTELLAIRTGSIAAMAFICGETLQSFLGMAGVWIKPTAILTVAVFSVINIFGLSYGKKTQTFLVTSKILALLLLVIFGFMSKKGNIPYLYHADLIPKENIIQLFGLAMIPILWTYGGWHENTFMGGETKDAKKNLPLALIIGTCIVASLYIATNCMYLYLIPIKTIANSNLVAADILQIILGENGKKVLELLIIVFCLGAINSMIITGSRVTYVMARDNAILRYMGEINPRFGTPQKAIMVTAAISIILIVVGSFGALLFFTGILVWIFFGLAASGLIILRKKNPHILRPYKVWGYPLVPVIFILVCLALAINTFAFYMKESLIGLGLLASGIPVYIYSCKNSSRFFSDKKDIRS